MVALELVQGRGVGRTALALPQDLAIPVQSVGFQAGEDALRGAGFLPGWIQVFHAHQPQSAVVAGVQVTGQGRNQ